MSDPAAQAMNPTDLLVATHRLVAAGAPERASLLYREWLGQHPDHPLRYAMAFNLGMLLSNTGELEAARDALLDAIRMRPDFLPAPINLGFVLERLGAVGEAVLGWQAVVAQLQAVNGEALAQKRIALKQLGRVFESVHYDPAAEDVLRQSLEIDPTQREVLQHWLSLRQRQCEWPVPAPFGEIGRTQMLASMPPLTLATYTDDPLLQLATAAHHHRHDLGRADGSQAHTHRRLLDDGSRRRLRIGYLSSDLRDHAIGHLIAEIFALHDRSAVEVFAYYTGHPVDDSLHARIRATVDHWRDLAALDDVAAAQRIADDGIAILVDVNGYTHGARTRMLTCRPAPVIVNWLGFPGTSGSPDHHYIIADDFIIPPEHEIYYSESVLRLPCYQPNDRQRAISAETPSRQEVGLPDDATVFCCFNGAHKITPFHWRRWMAILQRVPDSVLWLLQGVATTNDRLRRLASEHGVAPERLVFAGRRDNADHLARYRLADLFLDTTPYGAHTTASDALWAGLPIVTLAGRSFASRVCGSLVRSAGIGELVCATGEAYVELAVALALDPGRRAALRRRLQDGRDGCVLFDTPLLVTRLEALYAQIWRAAQAGRSPRPDLSNLDIYREIGASLDDDACETGATDLPARYAAALAERDAIAMIRPDARLWPGAPREAAPFLRQVA